MRFLAKLLLVGVFTLTALTADLTKAITITLDYSYDTSNFFGAGNPDGAAAGTQARNSLEAAAGFFSEILTDSFSSIQTPADYYSDVFNGVVTWQWQLSITNPSSGGTTTLYDETIASDEYRIYVGARSLSGNTLGTGGPGGWGWSSNPSGEFTPVEINQIAAISSAFSDDVSMRGEPSGFARWGGAVAFDNDAGTNWNYDNISLPSAGESDFYSVAIHELGHALGLGASNDWNNLVSDTSFVGAAASSEYGGPVPLDCSGSCSGHWAEGTTSTILGTSLSQEAAMDPTVSSGNRKRLTALDAAALTDIGWSVSTPTYAPADYDFDGDVDDADFASFETWFSVNGNADADADGDTDGADFLIWQQNYTGTLSPATAAVPEPNTAALMLLGVTLFASRRFRTT
ncbi:MAG: matrixin family metalloprotease [Planctomycetes bacterium]|nr:matrixin family metalloprotease [Planctomycetota bacterium]